LSGRFQSGLARLVQFRAVTPLQTWLALARLASTLSVPAALIFRPVVYRALGTVESGQCSRVVVTSKVETGVGGRRDRIGRVVVGSVVRS